MNVKEYKIYGIFFLEFLNKILFNTIYSNMYSIEYTTYKINQNY
jgi:hypothetical protein